MCVSAACPQTIVNKSAVQDMIFNQTMHMRTVSNPFLLLDKEGILPSLGLVK